MGEAWESVKRGLIRGFLLVGVIIVIAMAMAAWQTLTAPNR
jgi:hypothetical protein